jgi:hypothetical protein
MIPRSRSPRWAIFAVGAAMIAACSRSSLYDESIVLDSPGDGSAGRGGASPADAGDAADGTAPPDVDGAQTDATEGGAGSGGDGSALDATDGPTDADGDAGCDWFGNECLTDPWTTCVLGCSEKYQTASYVMQYKLLGCACLGLCSSYCIFGNVNVCTNPAEMTAGCQLCESIVFANNECNGAYNLCSDPQCKLFADCLTKCSLTPPAGAPMPKGGACDHPPDGGHWFDDACCPASLPAGDLCPTGSDYTTCVYGTVTCECGPGDTKWTCCEGAPPIGRACAPKEKGSTCYYGPTTQFGAPDGGYTECHCDGAKWSCQ